MVFWAASSTVEDTAEDMDTALVTGDTALAQGMATDNPKSSMSTPRSTSRSTVVDTVVWAVELGSLLVVSIFGFPPCISI